MDREARGSGEGLGGEAADGGSGDGLRERRVSDLLANVPGMVYRCRNERDWPMAFVSEACAELTGYDPAALEGGEVSWGEDVIAEEDRETVWETVQSETESEGTFSVTYRIETADGERRWVRDNGRGIFEDGALIGIEGVIVDITERKRLESELDEVFGRVSDAFFALDEEWRFTYLNERAHELINPEGRRLEGKDVWEEFPDALGRSFKDQYERAMYEQETVVFEEYYPDPLDRWFEVRAYPSETGLSVYFRDVTERKEREEELRRKERRYEAVFEDPNILVGLLDPDGTVLDINRTAMEYIDADLDAVTGEPFWETPWWRAADDAEVREWVERAAGGEYVDFEADLTRPDGQQYTLEGYFRPVTNDEGDVVSIIVSDRDVTERTEYEQRLQALNRLNEVVRDISDAVIEQSTRGEIEQIACERLAESDSYEFAWIGETHPATREIEPRAMAGVEGYLDDVTISIDPDDPESGGPTGRALRTGEPQTVQHVREDPRYEPWRGIAEEYGFEASAAIPIHHEDTIFGILNVYTDRPDGFESEERTVIDHLGEILGHAIASIQRKQALMGDTAIELELGIPDVGDDVDVDVDRLELDRAVPIGNDEFLVYGTSETDPDAVEAFADTLPYWEETTVVDEERDPLRFQARLSEPPLLSVLASVGGSVEHAVIEDGDYRITVHLPESADVRTVIDTLQDIYPQADALARRQVSVSEESAQRMTEAWLEELTDRQLTAIEVAYFSGFFEWPRGSSGEEVAESLGVSSPTFHQHVRSAERKLLDVVLSEANTGTRRAE